MDKFKTMLSFKLTIEEGSFVGAARRLNITKAAVSKQILELETHLKTQLLYRTTRSVQLTDQGRMFYEGIKKILSTVNDVESALTENQHQPSGTLRITSHRNFGEKYIIHHLKEFMDMYPALKIDLELADRFPDLEKENIDILCGVVHEGPEHLVRKKIGEVQHVLCASPEYLQKFGTPRIPEELHSHRYITHSFRDPDDLLVFKNDKEVVVDYCLRVNDAQAMMKCALQGLGFIKIHSYFVSEAIQNGSLVEILGNFRLAPKGMYVFYQRQHFVPSKIRFFLDFIYQKIKLGLLFHSGKSNGRLTIGI